MKYHPICLLFPQMSTEELQDLAEDIRIKGLRHRIVLYQGKILDGRNRYLACPIAGVEPRFKEWKGPGSPLQWVISENMIRRHLTSSQRAVLALELLPLLEQEAHERKRLSPGRGKNTRKKLRMFSENGEAREIARPDAEHQSHLRPNLQDHPGDGTRTRRGSPQRAADRARGSPAGERPPPPIRRKVLREMDGRPKVRLARLIRQEQVASRRASAKRFAAKTTDDGDTIVGDMGLLWKRLEDSSVKMFFADPPYADTEAYERLAELAAKKLMPGGWCLAYAGQMRLPQVMEAMGRHLEYFWTFAIKFSGSHCTVHARHVQNRWKPILAFARPPIKPPSDWVTDSLQGGGRDKGLHDWGQPQSEIGYLLRLLTAPGDLIVNRSAAPGRSRQRARSWGGVGWRRTRTREPWIWQGSGCRRWIGNLLPCQEAVLRSGTATAST